MSPSECPDHIGPDVRDSIRLGDADYSTGANVLQPSAVPLFDQATVCCYHVHRSRGGQNSEALAVPCQARRPWLRASRLLLASLLTQADAFDATRHRTTRPKQRHMGMATFSDIHSNWQALHPVLADMAEQNVDQIYCLGDMVGYGAYPNEVIALIRERHVPTVMGSYDDGVGLDKDQCGCAYTDAEMRRLGHLSLEWSREHASPENKAFLRWLLSSIRLQVHGKRLLLAHGSPRRINEYVYEDRAAKSLSRIAQSADADLLNFGHTHLPYVKEVDGVLFVNDGSVGKPKDGGPEAAYAIVEIGDEVKVRIRRVPYDVAAAVEAVRASGLPSEFADLLETASG